MSETIANARALARDPNASARDLKGAVKGLLNIIEDQIAPRWTPKERAAIDAIMAKQGLTEHAALRMGIKWYQIILLMQDEGYPVVRFQTREGELRPIGVPPGCQGE